RGGCAAWRAGSAGRRPARRTGVEGSGGGGVRFARPVTGPPRRGELPSIRSADDNCVANGTEDGVDRTFKVAAATFPHETFVTVATRPHSRALHAHISGIKCL